MKNSLSNKEMTYHFMPTEGR